MTQVEGIPEWKQGLRRLLSDLDEATRRATTEGGALMEKEAKNTLRLRSHPYGTPSPSPKGSPPAWVSGYLSRSWNTEPARPAGDHRWTLQTGPTAVYARIQELGGMAGRDHRTYVPYRPYMLPAYVRARGPIRDRYRARWAEVLERV